MSGLDSPVAMQQPKDIVVGITVGPVENTTLMSGSGCAQSPASNTSSSRMSGGGGRGRGDSDVFEFQDSEDEDDIKNNNNTHDQQLQGDNDDDRSFQQRRQQGAKEIASLLIDQSSQQSGVSHRTHQSQQSYSRPNSQPPQSQAMSEMLTQNADFTQMTQDDNEGCLSLSPFPPCSPIKPQTLPWGRMMPCHGAKAVDLLPRKPVISSSSSSSSSSNKKVAAAPTQQQQQRGPHFSMLGLDQLKSSDVFNVYSMGRSAKNEFISPRPPSNENNETTTTTTTSGGAEKEQQLHEWAYGLISNRHCRIYCTLPEDPKAASMPGSNTLPAASMEVWVEDESNNGTMINQTILLQRGQKRRLHSGDEVSLVNPETLRKRARDATMLQTVLQQHSFVFVNVSHQQQQMKSRQQQSNSRRRQAGGFFGSSLGSFPAPTPSSTSSAKRRKGLVNVRAMNYVGIRGPTPRRSPVPPTNRALYPLGLPTPKTGNVHPNNKSQQQPMDSASSKYGVPVSNRGRRRVSPPKVVTTSAAVAAATASPPLKPSSPRRIEQDYDIRDVLGRGTCGEVRRAIHRQTGKERAVKIIALPAQALGNPKQQQEAQQWQAEAKILQTLDHPYVVQLVDVYCTDTHLYLVMELCSGGDLFDRIIENKKYSEYDSRRVMRRLLSALHYIHEDMNLVHRDIKPENILLTGANDPCDVKITDFGVAKSASENLKTFCGTPLFFAPEVLKRRHTVHGQGRYGKAADVWSLGVLLYILLSGTPPYDIDGASGMDVILRSNVKIPFQPQNWASVSATAVDLIQKMLVKDPRKRITIREACDHPWFLTKDGDTHQHPLEDPKLISVTRKRLFAGGSPLPTHVTTAPSLTTSNINNPPAKRKRKVSMEAGVKVTLGVAVDASGNSDANNEQGLLDVFMDDSESSPQPAMPAERKCNQPADVSPTSIASGVVAGQSHPKILSVIDEHMSNSDDDAKSLETSGNNVAVKNTKLPDNYAPKLAAALKASILSGAKIESTSEVAAAKVAATLKAAEEVKQQDDQDNGSKSEPKPKKDGAVTKQRKHRPKKGDDDDDDVVAAAELDDDEICSQFSDDIDEAEVDTATIPEKGAYTGKKMKQMILAPLPEAATKATASTAKPKAKKAGGTAAKPRTESKSQTTTFQAIAGGKALIKPEKKQRTLMDMWK